MGGQRVGESEYHSFSPFFDLKRKKSGHSSLLLLKSGFSSKLYSFEIFIPSLVTVFIEKINFEIFSNE